MKQILFFVIFLLFSLQSNAQSNIRLPEPTKKGGMPLMEALAKRETARSFQSKELTNKQLSDLLWAAFGMNRADGKRTAPSSLNYQETDIYVLLPKGVYRYDASGNRLIFVSADDVRSFAGKQDFIQSAPVQLVLVADFSRMGKETDEEKLNTAHIDAGYISQNIYLFCTSAGLATGARGWIDREILADKLHLTKNQRIIVAHSVGYAQ